MKIREGFVSNSSSSSFICSITNQIFGGYDTEACDFDLVECVAGHNFLWYVYQIDLKTIPIEELKKNILRSYADNEQLVLKILYSDFDKYSKIIPLPCEMNDDKLETLSRLQIINLYFVLNSWGDQKSNWKILDSIENFDMISLLNSYIKIPESQCPICRLEYISNDNFYNYLEVTGFDVEKIKNEIRSKFKTSNELENFIYQKQKGDKK